MNTYLITLKDGLPIKIICESYQLNKETNSYEFIISANKIEDIQDAPKLAEGFRHNKPKLI